MSNVQSLNATLPPQHRESSFKRYEADIARAVASWPAIITIDPRRYGLSPSTICSRMRDAMSSYADNNWPSTLINRESFLLIREAIVIRHLKTGEIKVGPAKEITSIEPLDISTNIYEMPTPSTDDGWSILGSLLDAKCINRPIKIKMSQEQLDALFNAHDVNAEPKEDGFYILT